MPNHKEIILSLREEKSVLEGKRLNLVAKIDSDIAAIEATIKYYEEKSDEHPGFFIKKHISGLDSTNTVTVSKPKRMLTDTLKNTLKNVVVSELTKFQSAEKIVSIMLDFFPEKSDVEKKSFKVQISSLLSLLKKEGQIASFQFTSSKQDNVWGRKEWLNEMGQPAPGTFVNPKLVMSWEDRVEA